MQREDRHIEPLEELNFSNREEDEITQKQNDIDFLNQIIEQLNTYISKNKQAILKNRSERKYIIQHIAKEIYGYFYEIGNSEIYDAIVKKISKITSEENISSNHPELFPLVKKEDLSSTNLQRRNIKRFIETTDKIESLITKQLKTGLFGRSQLRESILPIFQGKNKIIKDWYFPFEKLPVEMQIYILSFVDPVGRFGLREVSTAFKALIENEDFLWKADLEKMEGYSGRGKGERNYDAFKRLAKESLFKPKQSFSLIEFNLRSPRNGNLKGFLHSIISEEDERKFLSLLVNESFKNLLMPSCRLDSPKRFVSLSENTLKEYENNFEGCLIETNLPKEEMSKLMLPDKFEEFCSHIVRVHTYLPSMKGRHLEVSFKNGEFKLKEKATIPRLFK